MSKVFFVRSGFRGGGLCITHGCNHNLAVHRSFSWYIEGPIPREAQKSLVGGFIYVGQ